MIDTPQPTHICLSKSNEKTPAPTVYTDIGIYQILVMYISLYGNHINDNS